MLTNKTTRWSHTTSLNKDGDMSTTEPGWYHVEGDPPRTQRFWDGDSWSDAPVPSPPGAPAPEAPEEAGTPKDSAPETSAADASSSEPDDEALPAPPTKPAVAFPVGTRQRADPSTFKPVDAVERTPWGWYTYVLKEKYAYYEGRARRSEYWWFTFFSVLIGLAILVVTFVLVGIFAVLDLPNVGTLIFVIVNLFYALAMLAPSISAGIRRLHDIDKSGWLMILAVIPGISVILIVLFFVEGTSGPNQFGADPKGSAT